MVRFQLHLPWRHTWLWIAAGIMWGGSGCGEGPDRTFTPEPDGRDSVELDVALFRDEVVPVLERQGCATAACHGSSTNPFPLTGNLDLDFLRVADQVDTDQPDSSPLLLKPLSVQAGGVLHDAPTIFRAPEDLDYQILLTWVSGSNSEVLP